MKEAVPMFGLIYRQTRVRDNNAIIDWVVDSDMTLTSYATRVHSSAAFPNGLETMCVYEIECGRPRSGEMWRLHNAYNSQRFDKIIDDMEVYACAGVALEAISNVCTNGTSVSGLFRAIISTLAVMEAVPEYALTALAWFETRLLFQVGAMPNIEFCSKCAKTLKRSSWYQQEVGFLCNDCANAQTNIETSVLDAIRRLYYQSLRTTMDNAVTRAADPPRLKRYLRPILRFLFAVLTDNSTRRWTKAYRFMNEMVFGDSADD